VTTTCAKPIVTTASRDAAWLVLVDGQRLAGVDEAEAARARAAIAEDHERRGAVRPQHS